MRTTVFCTVLLSLISCEIPERPLGEVSNYGFEVVYVSGDELESRVKILKGGAVGLSHGVYDLIIPELDKTIPVFKNNPGSMDIHYIDELLVIETSGAASVSGP